MNAAVLRLLYSFVFLQNDPTSFSRQDCKKYFNECESKSVFIIFDCTKNYLIKYYQSGCKKRFCPASTFKTPNSVITNKTREASDEKFAFHWDGVKASLEDWNRDYKLTNTFQYPVVWFYQKLAKRRSEEQMMADL